MKPVSEAIDDASHVSIFDFPESIHLVVHAAVRFNIPYDMELVDAVLEYEYEL